MMPKREENFNIYLSSKIKLKVFETKDSCRLNPNSLPQENNFFKQIS